ncbi:MAG: acetylxylan esterase [Candidatus Omnitrophica bacterium]|nr:acetylxylan esterase [Candidatus Omnitrophota bacterium]
MAWKANPEIIRKMSQEYKRFNANYDEKLVPQYKLPEVLVCIDGTRVTNKDIWIEKRRKEIYELFKKFMYGRAPVNKPDNMTFELIDHKENVLGCNAIRKVVRISYEGKIKGCANVLIYLPDSNKPCPIFLILNFNGNHAVINDAEIDLTPVWNFQLRKKIIPEEKTRGTNSSRYPVQRIIERGYGFATCYYGDIVPDFADCYEYGVFGAFDYLFGEKRPPDAWGAIGGWAWFLSRIQDYFEKDNDIDSKKTIVLGHSRLGKTALWAGAQDERFSIVISNDSGCGGAALSRRKYGETIEIINTAFPHWFCDNFKKFNNRENELPIDQHMLIALVAPRPVYIASADEDLWADPLGEFLSAKNAEPVYKLFGLEGLPVDDIPDLDTPCMGTIGYHIRTGKHDLTTYDWERFMDFADKHLNR